MILPRKSGLAQVSDSGTFTMTKKPSSAVDMPCLASWGMKEGHWKPGSSVLISRKSEMLSGLRCIIPGLPGAVSTVHIELSPVTNYIRSGSDRQRRTVNPPLVDCRTLQEGRGRRKSPSNCVVFGHGTDCFVNGVENRSWFTMVFTFYTFLPLNTEILQMFQPIDANCGIVHLHIAR